jgi:hypothetical protein
LYPRPPSGKPKIKKKYLPRGKPKIKKKYFATRQAQSNKKYLPRGKPKIRKKSKKSIWRAASKNKKRSILPRGKPKIKKVFCHAESPMTVRNYAVVAVNKTSTRRTKMFLF